MPLMPSAMSWPARVLYGIAFGAVLVLGFFFLTIALVAGAVVALVILARLWWLSRRARRAREDSEFEGEYRVIEHRETVRRIEPSSPPR